MAYVLTTFFIMGFGYFTAEAALERPLPGKLFAWIGYFLALAGAGLATVAIWTGRASVLYTFYPPLTASPLMYFAITYEIWPMLTGREPISARLQRRQLWLWFLGMMIMSLPWHWLRLHGQWRRVAQFDYSNPIIAAWGPWVVVSLLGGLLLLASALLFIWNLASVHSSFRSHPASTVTPYRFALAVHPPARVPAALNGFGLWNALLVFLMAATYGWPIAQQAFFLEAPHAVVHRVDRGG